VFARTDTSAQSKSAGTHKQEAGILFSDADRYVPAECRLRSDLPDGTVRYTIRRRMPCRKDCRWSPLPECRPDRSHRGDTAKARPPTKSYAHSGKTPTPTSQSSSRPGRSTRSCSNSDARPQKASGSKPMLDP